MVYRGTVNNGVVVLDPSASLRDGTRVRVEAESDPAISPRRGSPPAVLSVDPNWAGPPEEIDALLAEVQKMRDEDVDLQHRQDQ